MSFMPNERSYLKENSFIHSYTKSCALASVIFILNKRTDIISAPHALVYFCIVLFFVYFRNKEMVERVDFVQQRNE